MPMLIFALILGALGGTTVIAEKALPGDSFYNFKVNVEEPIAGMFAFSKEEKIEWKERIVERRLAEIQKLVSENNLSVENRNILEKEIKIEVEDLIQRLGDGNSKKDESIEYSNINLRLQAALKAYYQNIERLSNEALVTEGTKQESKNLLATLSDLYAQVDSEHQKLETLIGVSTKDSLDSENSVSVSGDKQKASEDLLNETKLLYQKHKLKLSADIQSIIEKNIIDSEKSIEKGKIFVESSDYINGTMEFQNSIKFSNDTTFLILLNTLQQDISGYKAGDDSSFRNDDDKLFDDDEEDDRYEDEEDEEDFDDKFEDNEYGEDDDEDEDKDDDDDDEDENEDDL